MTVTARFAFRGWVFLLASVLVCALVAGCGPSPDKVVAQFFQKMQAGDFDGAKKLCSDAFAGGVTNMESMTTMMGRNPFEGGRNPFVTEKLTTEMVGETAKVKSSDAPFVVIVLVKQKGFWKIDTFEVDFSALGDMMRNLPEDVRNRMPAFPGGR